MKKNLKKRKSSQDSLENYHLTNGVPGGIRTPDLQVRSLPFYPAKLQAHIIFVSIKYYLNGFLSEIYESNSLNLEYSYFIFLY